MKLVDKMILFNRFLRENRRHQFELYNELNPHKEYFKEQSRHWKDKSLYNDIDSAIDQIINSNKTYNASIDKINKRIDELLRKEELVVLKRDYIDYENTERNLDIIIEQSKVPEEFVKEISADIGFYNDWRWAGVDLNPSTGIHTKNMLSCDPLYLYTGNITDNEEIKNKFNNFFAEKRLLFYDDIEKLPQGQIGFACSMNCYEFRPIDPIKEEMKKVFNLLCPGGFYIFTYNDCEQEAQLDFLNGPGAYRTYNTKTLMTSLVEMIGFDIEKHGCWANSHSWMVIKKPGDRTSTKLSGALVKINNKENQY